MIQAFAHSHDHILGFRFVGKLRTTDYQNLVPQVDTAIARHGRIRLLVQFDAFHGWDAGALWQDLKFTASHFSDIERLAVVGESTRDAFIANLAKPFTVAKVRYFDAADLSDAWTWLEGESAQKLPAPTPDLPGPQPAGLT